MGVLRSDTKPRLFRPAFRRRLPLLLGLAATVGTPHASQAQLGAIETFARRVTDVSFYLSTGGITPASRALETGRFGLAAYGLELLFAVGESGRPVPGLPSEERDTVQVEWVQTTITRHDDHTDTTNVYEVRKVERSTPMETVWLFEMGLGYGQVVGFAGIDNGTELRGTVRDLPSVSFYASYAPVGTYFGFRSGFMKAHGLQYFDETGASISGKAESFMASGLVGYALEILGFNLFLESGYALRNFPSIEWSGGTASGQEPREMNLSGWFVSSGIQFQIAG